MYSNKFDTNKSRKHYAFLDGLRAVAILLVLLEHWISNSLTYYFMPGIYGVELFFVISGIINIQSIINNKTSIRNFFIKRFLRIVPIYVLYVLVCFILTDSYNNIALTSLLIPNIKLAFGGDLTYYFNHFWTLGIEIQFYLIFPFFIYFKDHKNIYKITLYFLLLIIPLTAYIPTFYNNISNPYILPFLGFQSILIGVYFSFKNQKSKITTDYNIIILLIVVFQITLLIYEIYTELNFGNQDAFIPLISIGYSLLIYKIINGDKQNLLHSLLSNKILVYLGKISYTIYIFHNLIYKLLTPYISKFLFENQYLNFFLVLVITTLICKLIYEGFEKPFLNLKTKLSNNN